jgi:hypothetical protein
MNDLLPPARRPIPEQRRYLMRNRLDDQINRANAVRRRNGALVRKLGLPALVAAAAAAVVVGGYLAAGTGDNPGGAPDPAGQGGAVTGQRAMELAQAYQQCVRLAKNTEKVRGEPIPDRLVGKLAVDAGKGITVVVANRTDANACNVKPDRAVSYPSSLDAAVTPESFAVALNTTRNYLPGDPGNIVWAGGALPHDVSSVVYTFPDGHQEPAITQDGYWVIQYLSPQSFTKSNQVLQEIDPITVTLDGPDGQRTLTLKWPRTPDRDSLRLVCNQMSHGC